MKSFLLKKKPSADTLIADVPSGSVGLCQLDRGYTQLSSPALLLLLCMLWTRWQALREYFFKDFLVLMVPTNIKKKEYYEKH